MLSHIKLLTFTLILGFFLFKVESRASTNEVATSDHQAELPSINEPWYTLWGFGFPSIEYEKDLQSAINKINSFPGIVHTAFNFDFFGFYWPDHSFKTMYGVVLNSVSDSIAYKTDTLTILQYTLAFSTHHFFGVNIGDGWFIRGDVGPTWYVAETIIAGEKTLTSSDYGLGLMFGGGYSFIIGKETRMPLGFYLAHRSVKGESITTTSLSLGFLF